MPCVSSLGAEVVGLRHKASPNLCLLYESSPSPLSLSLYRNIYNTGHKTPSGASASLAGSLFCTYSRLHSPRTSGILLPPFPSPFRKSGHSHAASGFYVNSGNWNLVSHGCLARALIPSHLLSLMHAFLWN